MAAAAASHGTLEGVAVALEGSVAPADACCPAIHAISRVFTAGGGSAGSNDHAMASVTDCIVRASAAHSAHVARCARTSAASAAVSAPSRSGPIRALSSSWSGVVIASAMTRISVEYPCRVYGPRGRKDGPSSFYQPLSEQPAQREQARTDAGFYSAERQAEPLGEL